MQTSLASRIILVDKDFESSKVLEGVLDILMRKSVIKDFRLPLGLKIIKFANKYEFNRLVSDLKIQLKCDLLGESHSSNYLQLAIALQDYNLCALAIERASPLSHWRTGGTEPVEDYEHRACLPGAWTMNPLSQSLEVVHTIPNDVFWAWCRAYHKAIEGQLQKPTKEEARVMSKEFLRLMTLP